jgi:hypothetical protein
MPLFGRIYARLPFHDANRFAPRPETRHATTLRTISCPHCGETLRVALRALNTRCTACMKHLLLEDVVVRGDSVRTSIITCGTILIEPSARFSGVLQGSEIVIAGRVMGTVIGTERVQVTSTGKVAGSIATRTLAADPHALIDGEVSILNADNTVSISATRHG